MVIHIFKQYYGVHTPYYVKQVFKLYIALFLNEKDKLQLNRHSGVNFGGQNVSVNFICGNLFLRIAGKISKIRTAKISCHTVCQVDAGPFQTDIFHLLTRKRLHVFKAIQAKTNIYILCQFQDCC